MPELPPAGWYHDPSTPGQQRLWTGSAWTQETRPLTVPPQVPQPVTAAASETGAVQQASKPAGQRRGKWKLWHKLVIIGIGLLTIVMVVAAIASAPLSQDDKFILAVGDAIPTIAHDRQIELAHAACSDITAGNTGTVEMAIAERQFSLTPDEAATLVGKAVAIYCPANQAAALQ